MESVDEKGLFHFRKTEVVQFLPDFFAVAFAVIAADLVALGGGMRQGVIVPPVSSGKRHCRRFTLGFSCVR